MEASEGIGGQSEEQSEGLRQAAVVPRPLGGGRPSTTLRDRQPGVPLSPAGGLQSSVRVLTPAGHSTPLSAPTRCPTPVIRRNPHFSHPQTLEWDTVEDELVGNIGESRVQNSLLGVEELRRETSKKVSETNPNL